MVLGMGVSWGQIVATTVTSLTTSSAVTESFSSTTGTTAFTTGFPTAWALVGSGSTGNGLNTSTPISTSSTAGWYGNADLGYLGSGNATNGNATWRLQNNTNTQITGFTISYKARMYKNGTAAPNLKVYYTTNTASTAPAQGTTNFTIMSSLNVADVATFSSTVNTTGITLTTSPSNNVTGLTITNTSYIYIRFIFDGGSSSDLFSIDDVAITPILAAATPTISTTGTLSAVNTTYGTASATPTSFTVSGANMSAGIAVTPPTGFEVATTSDFSTTIGTNASALTVGASGTISSTTVYVRLAATAAVGSSPFSGNIVLSSTSATSVNVATASSTVATKGLTITGLTGASKNYDGNTSASFTGTAAYNGLANGQTFSVTGTPTAVFSDAAVGTGKTITISGYTAPSTNYSLTQPALSADIIAVVPGAPTIGASTAGNGQANVAFSAPSFTGGASITGYTVTSSPDGITASGATSPITITGLTNGTAYTFSVVATNSAGNSTSSSASNSVTPSSGPTVPDAPIIGSATSGNTQVSVAFTTPASDGGSAITGYTVTSTPGGFTGTGASSPIVVSGLTNGTAYTFTVIATNSVGNSVSSSDSNSVTPATTPSAPTISGITAGNGQLTVAFSAGATGGSAITNYKYSTDNGATFTACSPFQTVSPIVIIGLTNGTTYSVQIKAVNSVGDGTACASTNGTPATTPSAATITGITVGNSQLSVAFSAPSSEGGSSITNYKYSTDNGATFTAVSPASTASPIVITGLTNGTAYNVQIRAVNAIGDGTATASTSGTPATTPSAPTITGITAGDTQLSVAFTAGASGGSAITNYKYSTNGGTTFTALSTPSTASPIVITGLTNGTAYSVQIKAVNSLGDGVATASSTGTPALPPVVLAGWQFGSPVSTGDEATFNATTTNTNLSTVTLSRGVGVAVASLARGFSATTWDVGATKANAVTNNEYFQFVLNANSGFNFSLTTLDATLRRTSTAPNAYIWKYSTDGTNFTEIGTDISFTGVVDGVPQSQISLSGIAALQNAKSITFRIYAWGDITNNTGTFAFARYASGITTNCLAIGGNSFQDLTPPTLTADATANTVDNNIDITFTEDATWRSKITAVKIGSTALIATTDYDITSAGNIQLKPSGSNALLTASGSKAVTVVATGYTDATVTQAINAGVPTANSTATISAILAPGASRTITCTAKDQYSNLVSGYAFKYDATIVAADATTTESYTIDGTAITATANDIAFVSATNASGVATFTAALPASIDANDGISLQVQLSDGSTNVGSAFAYHELPGQTITFTALSAVTYGDAAFTVSATGGASGNPVTFTSSNPLVATCTGTNGTTITILKTGTTTIRANQAGNSGYNAAAQVDQLLTVNTKGLTITGLTGVNKVYNGSTTATSSGTATYFGLVNSESFSVTGTPVLNFSDSNVGTGKTITIAGYTAPSTNYTVTQPTLTADITQASQTISFGSLPNRVLGGATFTLTQNTTPTPSGPALAINYVSSDTNVATISGNTVTIVGVGTTTITATQPGDSNYSAATTVTQSQTILPVPIAGWDFYGIGSVTNTAVAATTFSANLVSISGANTITRGATAGWNSAGNSFSTAGFKNEGISTTNTDYFQITLAPAAGKQVSLSTINANFDGTSTFYATPGVTSQYAYSLDGSTFTLIGSPITSTSLKPTEIDLTGIVALQNVPPGTTITIRYYASGQTTSGGWRFSSPSVGVNGLAIGGSFTTINSWTGSNNGNWSDVSNWSSGALPTTLENATITSVTNQPTISANTAVKSLTIATGATVTVTSGTNLTVSDAVINNGTFTLQNNANLIQTNEVANTGNAIVNRNSANIQLYDYTLWSSPVASQQLQAFSPSTLATRFYTYNFTDNLYNVVSNPAGTTFDIAKGYLIRAPNTWTAGASAAPFSGTFTGVPNNGTIPVTLNYTDAARSYNLVGNPYPSTIDAETFLTVNSSSIENALYFWRKTNGASGSAYATYTLGGATTSTPTSAAPNGTIQVGQGFFVKAKSATTLNFTNAMRLTSASTQFFRTTSEIERNRIWLNLTNTSGVFSQMLVGYMTDATLDVDSLDGKYINDSPFALTSLINSEEYTIQGKPLPFDTNDTVPLGFKTNAAGNFTIGIDHVDGLFSNGQTIYLKDNLVNTTYNLSSGDYSFASDAGTYNSRFEIVYQSALALPTFTANNVIVYSHNGEITINSGKTPMNQVRIFDVRGRLLAEKNHINATETKLTVGAQNQVLLVKIGTTEGGEVTKKIIQ